MAGVYQVAGTPSAVLINPEGTVGSPLVSGSQAIAALVAQAVEGQAPCPDCGKVHAAAPTVPVGKRIGEPAPELVLPDLSGKSVDLADFRGEKTLVLFWNPSCGFCQQMLPDLKAWEANRPERASKLLVVSAGTEEANQPMSLDSPVVLDQNFGVGREFGASGTPSAVLVDAEGNIASEVAVGAPKVLDLAKGG